MSFLDVQSPIFRPLWLRVLIVAACLGWAVVELTGGSGFWSVIFGASGIYLAYQFFVVFDPDQKDEEK
jgi:uncharacterized membrane protein